ncbi:MAG: hypothetical protein ACLBM1_07955 [Cuspidothrix sp.]
MLTIPPVSLVTFRLGCAIAKLTGGMAFLHLKFCLPPHTIS